jgi:hypothetical protein
MKRLAPCFLLLCLVLAAAPPAAKAAEPVFNTVVIKHFTNADGMNQSQEFINAFAEGLRSDLPSDWFIRGFHPRRFAKQGLSDGATVSDADATNSLVIEGKFIRIDKGAILTKVIIEFDIYRLSDHVLVKTVTAPDEYLHESDTKLGDFLGIKASNIVMDALKGIDLASIPAGPPVPRSAPSAPASAVAQPAAPAFASVQFSSSPAGAEITIDGAYAGNTPSLIKLRAGTHSIRVTKNGYAAWERSIDTGTGESRNVAANLEKTSP